MNRAAVAVIGIAAAILVGALAARRSAVRVGDSREPADTQSPRIAKQRATPSVPTLVLPDHEIALVEEANETPRRAPAEMEDEPVDFERLASAIPLDQISSTLARLSDDEADQNLRAELLRRWASAHPADAAQWAAGLPAGDKRRNALTAVAAEWASLNIPAARDWAQSLDAAGRDVVMITLSTEAASQNPLVALELAQLIQGTTARANAIAFAAAQWAANDPQAALDWTTRVSDAAMRRQLDRWVTPALAEFDPAAAAEYVASRSAAAPDTFHQQIAVEVVQRWTQQSPQAAARWVEAFADPNLRVAALDAVMRIWVEADSAKAGDWLSRQPAGQFREEATTAYAAAIAPAQRAAALGLASGIQDGARRGQLLTQIASLDTPPTVPSAVEK